jgi:hypothetical protein
VTLADAVRNPWVKQRFYVYADGVDVASLGMRLLEPPKTDQALHQFCATCELKFNFIAEEVRVGARIQVVEELDGYRTAIFTGTIMRPGGTSWPPRNMIWCSDALWDATQPRPDSAGDLSFENVDDGAAIVTLLETKGLTNHSIISSNWTIGTLYRIILPRRTPPSVLMQRIDALASMWTMASGSGLIYRIPLPLFPGAPDAAAFNYAWGATGDEYKVYDANWNGDGKEEIRNEVTVTGARLTQDYEADALDVIPDDGFTYDDPVELGHLPIIGSVQVISDPGSGSVVFVEGDDYEIDYVGVGDPLVGRITIPTGSAILDNFHTPLNVSYEYVLSESGGQITASAGADNAYLDPGVRIPLPINDDLIQSFEQADRIVYEKLLENNRLAKRLSLVLPSNPALHVGQTITYRDPRRHMKLPNATSFLVISISRQGKRMSVECIGGDGGEVTHLDPRPPIADFEYVVVRAPHSKVFLWLNADRVAWDPDGDIASYAWEDDENNTAAGPRASFVYDLDDTNTVTISLVVTDSTGLQSQVLSRTINLLGSQTDINEGRYQYVRAVWYQAGEMFVAAPNGTSSTAFGASVNNPISRYYGPRWRIMDQRGRVLLSTLNNGTANTTYMEATNQARTYTSWLSSQGLLVYQDGADVVLKVIDVGGTLVPSFVEEVLLGGYTLPPVVSGINGLEWAWYHPSDPSTMRVVSQSHILESPQGKPWRPILASAGYGGSWRGMAATAFDAAYVLDIESTTPIVMSDGSQPEFPEAIEVKDIGAWYTSSRYIVNCRWLLEKVEGEWVVQPDPIEYAGFIEPQVGGLLDPIPLDERVGVDAGWRVIPYPAVDDLFFLGGGSGEDELEIFGPMGTYLYALTTDGSPAKQVSWFTNQVSERPETMPSVAGPSLAPIEAVMAGSDDTFLALEGEDEAPGWLDVNYVTNVNWQPMEIIGA